MDKVKLRQEIDRVYQAIDSDEPDNALQSALKLVERCPDRPEAMLALASAATFVDLPRLARESCEKTIQMASQMQAGEEFIAQAQSCLARLEFRMWELDKAEERIGHLLASAPDNPELWNLLARLHELAGRWDESRSADREAARLDPENYPLPVQLSEDELEEATRDALEQLPSAFQDLLNEVPIVIEDFPDREMSISSSEEELPVAPDTLGLFVGTSLLDRSFFNALEAPGTIFLFKRNLERACPDHETLIQEITITLWHELAHFLGFEEEDMPRLGLD